MTSFIALLCAVNVGGTGKLPMSDLKAMCETLGFIRVRTYIASGNVIFESSKPAAQVRKALAKALEAYAGKPVGVHIRDAGEMAQVLKANPFPKTAPNHTVAIFLEEPPPKDAVKAATGKNDEEEIHLGLREIYVHYGSGMGRTKLKIHAAKGGTARNMNTIAKLAEMAASG